MPKLYFYTIVYTPKHIIVTVVVVNLQPKPKHQNIKQTLLNHLRNTKKSLPLFKKVHKITFDFNVYSPNAVSSKACWELDLLFS